MSVQGRRRVVTNEFLPIAANNHPQKRTKEEEEAKEGGRGAANKSYVVLVQHSFFLVLKTQFRG